MIVESFAIIAIIFAMAFIFLRAGKKTYAYGILPLLLLPVMQICMKYITGFLTSFLPFSAINIKVCIIFITLIVACILMGFTGSKLNKTGGRTMYLIICCLFTLVLAMIFVLDTLRPLI